MEPDPTKRLSSRVEGYIRYRPGYPADVIAWLTAVCGLSHQSRIADIGSGTGILTRLFLDVGCDVFAIEPNPDMRAGVERQLADVALPKRRLTR